MPDRTGIDHSWDRNSDRAHLLLAQNRNKMQCDGLRNVWCSHCANNFCLAFRFQYFFFFSPLPFTPPRTWPLPLPLNPVVILLTNWNAILSILSRHRYNTAYRTKRLSSAARVKCVSLKRHQRPDLSCPSFSFRFDTTLPECNARVYKHSSPKMHRMSHGGETKTQRLFERVGKASSVFNFARFF